MKQKISVFFLLFAFQVFAQSLQPLYVVCVDNSGGAGGLYQYKNDTTWVQSAWKNGRFNGISVNTQNSSEIFLAAGHGAMRSLDGGKHWKVTTDWHVTEVQDVAIHPLNPSHVLISTAYGIWQSLDKGDTWKAVNQDFPFPPYSYRVEADRDVNDRFIAANEKGLFITENAGNTWKQVPTIDYPVTNVKQNVKHKNIWIASTLGKSLLYSENNGKTWNTLNGLEDISLFTADVCYYNPDILVASGYKTGLYVSVDKGKTWAQKTEGLPTGTIQALAFDLDKKGRIWVGTIGYGVYYTDDLGDNWTYAGLAPAKIGDLCFWEGLL